MTGYAVSSQWDRKTPLAGWSTRIAFFSVQLLLLGIILHRLAGLPTMMTVNLFFVVFLVAALAIVLALAAFVQIWRYGVRGTGLSALGALVGLLVLAWPATVLPFYLTLPKINDITTDAATPPRFIAVARIRDSEANSVKYPGIPFAVEQVAAYPNIEPIIVKRPLDEVFDVTRGVIEKKKWDIVTEEPPAKNSRPGRIEAVDKTMILGFPDDISVRIGKHPNGVKVDIRSASRYGHHDFGRNAKRVRNLLKTLHARLDLGDADEISEKQAVQAKKKKTKKRHRRKKRAASLSRAQRARVRKARRRTKRVRRRRRRTVLPRSQ